MNSNNSCILNIAGKNSNDIYTVSVPSNLLGFCRYDFSRFMENSYNLCRESIKTGKYPEDEIKGIRNSISGCHRYVENNLHTVFGKIVLDCWIEYICRQGEINTSTLWNSFSECRNPFQMAVFQRLTEYRSHHAINQWINLLKMQEYAKKKLDYVFGAELNSVEDAVGRLNIFDLMFSVAANEQGYSLDAIGSVKVYKPGRLTNAPFVYSGAAKEVVRNLFKDVHFADNLPYASKQEGAMSDWEAMDAFNTIKGSLPDHNDKVVNIIIKTMTKTPDTVYIPSGFKAIIDLEIDALLNSGAFLQRCGRCKEFYVRDDYYTSPYCDTIHKDGSTCREIMEKLEAIPPSAEELLELREKSDRLYREMSGRIGKDITQREFTEWVGSYNMMKKSVINGQASFEDFDQFSEYSKNYSFEGSRVKDVKPIEIDAEVKSEPPMLGEKKVKPYQFARVDRKELERQGLLRPGDKYPEDTKPSSPFGSAPAVVPPPAPPVSRIIRSGSSPVQFDQKPVEIPVRREEARVIPKDVYLGEDFSKPSTPANAGESARAAIDAMTRSADSPQQNIVRSFDRQNQNGERKHLLPDLDQFPDSFAPSGKSADNAVRSQRTAEQPAAASENTEEKKSKAPKIKLPGFDSYEERQHKDSPFAAPEGRLEEFDIMDDIEGAIGETVEIPDSAPVEDDLGEIGEIKLDLAEKPKAPVRKPPEMNRAARVVSAYKTVSTMPEPAEEENGVDNSMSDDFAKILGNIERNDGFEEEDLPVDPDGIPLSHKTKHVMDAIMRNSGVSPSLVYGRRRAAEKNVIIDEGFMDKKEENGGDGDE
ncbi:MAG: hypothetical protein NC203_10360 [Firmicutes bacterium]|nr:hypothetical protein [[Eubacterium] siraeum]MCM1488754.1 hypothetical protein [Bacillota bacterium]